MTRRMTAERWQAVQSPPPLYEREEKKLVSRLGWVLAVFVSLTVLAATAMTYLVGALAPNLLEADYYPLLMNVVVQYCLAFPFCIWLLNKLSRTCIRQRRLRFADGVRAFIIGYFLMCFGGWLSVGTETILSRLFGITQPYSVDEILTGANFFAVVLVGAVLAPIFEEVVFRKLLLDRLVKYGELPAVLTSGILFGLYHGNFQQLFYAAFLGALFAYIYVRTGRVRYCVILHMLINFNGLVLGPLALANQESAAAAVYIAVYLAMIIIGFVLLIKNRKRVHFAPSDYDITGRDGAAIIWLNPGMLAALLMIIASFIGNFLFAV